VAGEAERLGEEEYRALPFARVLERPLGDVVDRLDVLAVDLHGRHAECLRAFRQILDGQLLLGGRGLRVMVVLADEDGRHRPQLREVQRLVERADVRRPVAEERDRHARLAAHLEGEGGADDPRQATPDDRVRAQIPALHVIEVHGAAVAVAHAFDLAVELRHHLVRMRSLGQRVPVRAVR